MSASEVLIPVDMPGNPRPVKELLDRGWKVVNTPRMRKPSWDTLLEAVGPRDYKVLVASMDEDGERLTGLVLFSPDGVRKIVDWLAKNQPVAGAA